MKRIGIIWLSLLLALLFVAPSCGGVKKREKITDPVQQQALRTRNQDIPVDSLFTSAAAKEIASPFKKIAISRMIKGFRESWAVSADKATREKYEEHLVKKEKMKKPAAKKKAEKATPEELAEYEAGFSDRLEVTFRDIPAEDYSKSLTFYFFLMLIIFAIIFTVRVIKTFFISPK